MRLRRSPGQIANNSSPANFLSLGLHPWPTDLNVSFPEVRVDGCPFHVIPEGLLEIGEGHADVLSRNGDIGLTLVTNVEGVLERHLHQ